MPLEESLRKVKYDLLKGDLEKARQRLTGMLSSDGGYPYSLRVRRMLGDICWKMGDKIEAGRYWYLEEHKTPEMIAACERFEKACHYSVQKIGWRLKLYDRAKLKEQSLYAYHAISELETRSWEEFHERFPTPSWDSSVPRIDYAKSHHVLVVDSTGFLRNLPITLTKRYDQDKIVTVILGDAQYAHYLDSKYNPQQLNSVVVDFENPATLEAALTEAAEHSGPFEMGVVWIPGKDFSMHQLIAKAVSGWYFHILDYHVGNPEQTFQSPYRVLREDRYGIYHQIVIGWKDEQGQSRWHTWDEATSGIIRALERGWTRTMIGTVQPWGNRPHGEPTYPGEEF